VPWHRRTRKPDAHWGILLLALAALLGTLCIDGFAHQAGIGTARPRHAGLSRQAPPLTGPVVQIDGDRMAVRRLPDRTVALTFDDGPDPEWTPRILDALRRHGVKATFFVLGAKVNDHPELVRRILAEGHELGLHSFNHDDLTDVSPVQRRLQLELTRNAVARASGLDVRLFRPPYSSTPASVDAPELDLI
jgi:peptidoglycan/xylan/chitin deacetylase (PgdA/CDA1 family)